MSAARRDRARFWPPCPRPRPRPGSGRSSMRCSSSASSACARHGGRMAGDASCPRPAVAHRPACLARHGRRPLRADGVGAIARRDRRCRVAIDADSTVSARSPPSGASSTTRRTSCERCSRSRADTSRRRSFRVTTRPSSTRPFGSRSRSSTGWDGWSRAFCGWRAPAPTARRLASSSTSASSPAESCTWSAVLGDRTWSVDAAPDAFVEADGGAIEQVLLNLVSNAVRHTAAGQAIDVRVGATVNVTVEVADAGEGIDPVLLPTLFDRFTRADAARGRDTGGAGLGLAICRAIVEAHGGTISVESAPTRGATFTSSCRGWQCRPAPGHENRLTPGSRRSPPVPTVSDDAAPPRRPTLGGTFVTVHPSVAFAAFAAGLVVGGGAYAASHDLGLGDGRRPPPTPATGSARTCRSAVTAAVCAS